MLFCWWQLKCFKDKLKLEERPYNFKTELPFAAYFNIQKQFNFKFIECIYIPTFYREKAKHSDLQHKFFHFNDCLADVF